MVAVRGKARAPKVVDQYGAELELTSARRSTVRTAGWRKPKYVPVPFHDELGVLCNRIAASALDGSGLRATCSAPPRHGKTELIGIALPLRAAMLAQRAGRDAFAVLYVTASAQNAKKVSLAVRAACERIHRETGDEWWAPGDIWEGLDWQTKGGFTWRALGWSSGTGGIGCHLLIMDDLIGSGATYRSRAKREAIRLAVQEDLLSRIMDGGAAVHMETRRGTEDTTGWLLQEYPEVWEEHVWRCRAANNDYLWPAKYGAEWRAKNPHLTDSSPVWRALYQQEPVPEGGTLVPPDWLDATYSEPCTTAGALADRIVIGVDLAAKAKSTSDACAFVVLGARGAFRDVLHVRAERMDYPTARQYLRELAAEWQPAAIVVEGAANGDALVADLQSVVPGIRGESPRGDKVARLTPHLPTMAARQVRLPVSAPWVRSFREEVTGFAGIEGEPDDQVDAFVWAMVAAHAPEGPSASDWAAAF